MQEKYQIFISYRREGGEDLARILEYKLTDRGFKVFFDVESLRSGAFNTALFEKIAECTDVLVVLPPHGLDRCNNPEDWVRLEIARALELGKNVIPVMMRNFTFPETLPEDIDALRYMNGISASNEYFEATLEKLISKLLHSKPFNDNDQLEKSAQNGDVSAMNEIALRYEFGLKSLPINRRKAFSYYEQAAATGEAGALYNLGDVYEKCEKDLSLVYDYGIESIIAKKTADDSGKILHKLAVECYAKAKAMNFAPAIYRLANFAEEAQDFKTAIELYQAAADLNYPLAQNALGYYKMNAIMTNRDIQAALTLFEKAATANCVPAIYNYAHALELKDAAKAAELYKRIAFLLPQAAFSLAQLYENSFHDLRSAIDYYRIAAESGVRDSEEKLRHCQDILFGKN